MMQVLYHNWVHYDAGIVPQLGALWYIYYDITESSTMIQSLYHNWEHYDTGIVP